MKLNKLKIGLLLFVCVSISLVIYAGELVPPATPDNAGSAFYSLEDLYQRLNVGTTGTKRPGGYVEPNSGPVSGTMHNLDEIMGKMPAVDATNGASDADVLNGKTYWGLTSGQWGPRTGSMVAQTLSATSANLSAGYYAATTLSDVDTDLATDNIKAGVTIFGVSGKTEVVDTTSGDASASDIKSGKKAWVDGNEITGTSPGAGVIKTGQTTSYATGDDGDLEKGLAWTSPRFTDNGDGTITDNSTGLMWLKNARNNGSATTWSSALTYCNSLDTSGYDDWRLPNAREFHSLIDYSQSNPALPSGHPFINVQNDQYWTSTTYTLATGNAWYIAFDEGRIYADSKFGNREIWPVRGGQ